MESVFNSATDYKIMNEQTITNPSTLAIMESFHTLDLGEEIELYDAKNIDAIKWPDSENGNYAKQFLLPLIKKGVSHFIDNIDVDIQILKHQNLIVPLTIIDEKYGISYVCSPYDHYISHAIESMHFIKNKLLNRLAKTFTIGLGRFLRLGKLNKVINVNNWLLATDLYPVELSETSIDAIVKVLRQKFPSYAIVFRSINPVTHPKVYESLRKKSDMIVSRQIYLSDTKNESIFTTRIFKSDLKLLKASQYEILSGHQLSAEDFPKVIELYKMLYIDKYSNLSPNLNANFIQLMVQQNLLSLKVLKRDKIIHGVVGYFCRNGVMTSPFFGYNQSESQHSVLYRLLSTILILEAKEKGMVLHQGAGASFYKKLRRAESHIEYMAVYHKHLPFRRRVAWGVLKEMMNRVAIKLMKQY